MLRWDQTEFLLKGVYLGLLVMIAYLGVTWPELGGIGLATLSGLVLFLGVAAWRKQREGYRVRGHLLGFSLFLLLENPGTVYAGLLTGLTVGVWLTFRGRESVGYDALVPIAGGAVLGLMLYGLRHVEDRRTRFGLGLALAALLAGGAAAFLYYRPDVLSADQQKMIAVLLLLGIPGYYLLTFASLVEESEADIAALCGALGASIWLLGQESGPAFGGIALAVPAAVYFLYTWRILPGLRVLKHALRGISYRQVGNVPLALVSLRRALQLDPQYGLAREQLWEIHRELDADKLREQPDVLCLIDFDMCLDRVGWLLLQDRPGPERIAEAQRLLTLIHSQRPEMEPACSYWSAVARTHLRHYEAAAHDLDSILHLPQSDSPYRRQVHFPAWQLALLLHPELQRRVGTPLMQLPGERMDAIAAVERRLARQPQDESARDLQRLLYSELTEAEYAAAPAPTADTFNYEYVQQLGLALLAEAPRWRRGAEYLRIAAHGLPAQAPKIYMQIAQACEKVGERAAMWANYRHAMQLGRAHGAANVPAEQQKELFTVVKEVGDAAAAEDQIDTALEAYKFYVQYEGANKVEAYRMLAELFERRKDAWMALHCTEHALSYGGEDRDLLERKDRYYYSVTPDELKARLEDVRKWFDVNYCLTKARFLVEKSNADPELLDWALHLADLAQVVQPGSIAARYLRARVRRMRGDSAEAITLLENIRLNRPEKFANEEEKNAWYFAHRLLGDLYLDEKPDQAVLCYQEFRQSDHGGADSLYRLGRAYENLGDFARAARCYEGVTGYEQHPLYYEARDALERVRQRPVSQ